VRACASCPCAPSGAGGRPPPIGIAEDDLPHVFERFYRADQARGAAEPRTGSGIGLTIARELLAANGGRIAIEKTGPRGTTLLIGLPAA
jgi:signal transduction histidine kinase